MHVVDPTIMDLTVVDPSVMEPHVMEPHVPRSDAIKSPVVPEPFVSRVSVNEPDVGELDVEQEEEAAKTGKPLLRQQPGPDAPQTHRASAMASLAYRNARTLQNQQYANAERYITQQTNNAQFQVYHPCFSGGVSCAASARLQTSRNAQQMLSKSVRSGESARLKPSQNLMQRGVHVWSRPAARAHTAKSTLE